MKLSILSGVLILSAAAASTSLADDSKTLKLELRKRVPTGQAAAPYKTTVESQTWNAGETAVIICDMWDLHHCKNAVTRVKEMAPRMNQVVEHARRLGALIIHAPSSCMAPYEGHPARLRAQNAPKAGNLPEDIGQWCHSIPAEELGKYPIDQSDGGEDDDPKEHEEWAKYLESIGRDPRAPWKKQVDAIGIKDADAITDSGVEVWNLLEHHKIENVILVGVHVNMCVLGRPFGLRQLAKNGKNVVLMRDMTDSMYNPKAWPYVNHYEGTDLIIEHIEKFVCPTVTSDQLLGGKPFVFSMDPRKAKH